MDLATSGRRVQRALPRLGRLAASLVLLVTALAWDGWATGILRLTRISANWPPMKPWTAVWLAALAVALLVQSGRPSPARVWVGRGLAVAVGVTSAVVLAEYATGRAFGLDQMWFADAVRSVQPTLSGRPSPQTVSSTLLLSVVIALNRMNRPWPRTWAGILLTAMVMPFVTVLAYLFGAVARLNIAASTGMALPTAMALLLLGAATVLLQPGWLIARSDRLSLIRLAMILAGFPLLIGLSRRALLGLGLGEDLSLTLATALGAIVLGAAAYRLSRDENELRKTSESDRTLLQASLDGMLDPQVLLEAERDSSGTITGFVYREVNQATCAYLGLSRADLLGRGLLDRLPGIGQSGLMAAFARCADSGEPVILDDFTYDNEILAETRRYEIRATRATPTTITLTWRDVTERFRTAQRIAESELRLRLVMDNAAVGMCITAPDGRFETVNEALCEFFGYDAETLSRLTWQELTAPHYVEADLRNVGRMLSGEIDSYRVDKQFVHADGHLVWGNQSVACLRHPSGEVERYIGQIIDISASVRANEQNRILNQRLRRKADQMAADLESAAAYMTSIMPRGLNGPVTVSSRYLPSRQVGGDVFDYTWIDDDHLLVYLIDVSGHGIEPALLSVSVHNMLRSRSLSTDTLLTPEAVLSELNVRFQMEQHDDHYFTMWYGVYEVSSRTLRYASAGAPPALAFNFGPATDVVMTELLTASVPIGMFEDSEFMSRTYAVPPGCQVVVYSDGASEITLADGRQLTPAAFKDLTSRVAGSPDWTLDELIDELNALTPSGAFDDDCSLIQLNFH